MPGGSEFKPAQAHEEVAWTTAAYLVARRSGVAMRDIMSCGGWANRATPALAEARRSALYLAATGGNLPARALMRATGLKRPTLRYHLRMVEDDRDLRAGLDELLTEMERRLAMALGALAA